MYQINNNICPEMVHKHNKAGKIGRAQLVQGIWTACQEERRRANRTPVTK